MSDKQPGYPRGAVPNRHRTFSFEAFYLKNRRLLIWIILGFLLWLLRSFFSLIFLTFVFTFIAAPISNFLVRRLRMPHWLTICITFGAFVALLASVSTFVIPQVAREAMSLVGNLPKTEERLLELRRDVVSKSPSIEPVLMNYLRSTIPDDLLAELSSQMEAIQAAEAAETATPAVPLSPILPVPPDEETLTQAEREILRAARED